MPATSVDDREEDTVAPSNKTVAPHDVPSTEEPVVMEDDTDGKSCGPSHMHRYVKPPPCPSHLKKKIIDEDFKFWIFFYQ